MKDEKLRQNWRANWLCRLLALADIDLQQRWLDKKITNPAWTYVEFICGYFDDCIECFDGYEYLLENGFLSNLEYSYIREFHEALDNYKAPNGDYDPAAILNDAKWLEIVALGHEAMLFLKQMVIDPLEMEIFSKKLYAPELTTKDYTWPNG